MKILIVTGAVAVMAVFYFAFVVPVAIVALGSILGIKKGGKK